MRTKREDSFWIVWSPEGKSPPTVRHQQHEEAVSEAKRLARKEPGATFFVMGASVSFKVNDLEATEYEQPLPF